MKDRHKKEKKSTRKHHRILWVFAFFLVVGIGVTGGTSIIIIVGVVLETLKQIESMMLVRNYKGFLDN